MARSGRGVGLSVSRMSLRDPVRRIISPDDSVLQTDSEDDEFAEGFAVRDTGESEGEEQEEHTEGGLGVQSEEGVALWQPDDWEGTVDSSEGEDDDGMTQGNRPDRKQLRQLEDGLTSLPFSTLLKAQRVLRERSPSSSSSQSSKTQAEPSGASGQRVNQIKAKLAELQRRKGKATGVTGQEEGLQELEEREAKEVERLRRESKHAPTAMSSKKQVTRMRRVVDVSKPERRDPRFSTVSAGQVNPELHTRSYGFLPDLLRTELKGLKTSLAAATKTERTCAWSEKPVRTAERERLEGELGRLRTRLERAERETRDREVLAGIKRQEREKQAAGKGAWFMKKGEKRDVLLHSRFDALEERGGKTAVKKAIDKKRKKVASKEKRSRPFAKGEDGLRQYVEADAKRRRVG